MHAAELTKFGMCPKPETMKILTVSVMPIQKLLRILQVVNIQNILYRYID